MSKRSSKLTSYIFVTIQLIIFAVLIFLPSSSNFNLAYLEYFARALLVIGLAICLLAIWQLRNYSLTALPAPVDNAKLLTKGLYRYVRHPIYTGVILAFLGVALGSENILKIILWAMLVLFFYVKSKYEESLLCKQFPGYKEYQKTTGRFLPKIKLS